MDVDPVPPTWMKYGLWLIFIISIVMLNILLVYVPVSCGQMEHVTDGEYVCDLETGWYIYTGAFVILLLYSVYTLHRISYGGNYRLTHLFSK